MAVMIPDIFSAYLQGKRSAIQDNWSDLANYNSVLKGQLGNAMDMATFGDNVRRNLYNTQRARFDALRGGLQAINDAAILDTGLGQQALVEQYGIPNAQAQYNAAFYRQGLQNMLGPMAGAAQPGQPGQPGQAQQGGAQQGLGNPPNMRALNQEAVDPNAVLSVQQGVPWNGNAADLVPLVQGFAGGDPGITSASLDYYRAPDGSIVRRDPSDSRRYLYVSNPYD